VAATSTALRLSILEVSTNRLHPIAVSWPEPN
jgi:hypothetical protein